MSKPLFFFFRPQEKKKWNDNIQLSAGNHPASGLKMSKWMEGHVLTGSVSPVTPPSSCVTGSIVDLLLDCLFMAEYFKRDSSFTVVFDEKSPSIHPSNQQILHPSSIPPTIIHQPIQLYNYLSIHRTSQPTNHPSSIQLTIYPTNQPTDNPFIRPSIHSTTNQ